MDKDHIKSYFWKNGYVVLRNIYNDEQIQRYREFKKKNIEEIVGQGKKNWKDIDESISLRRLHTLQIFC